MPGPAQLTAWVLERHRSLLAPMIQDRNRRPEQLPTSWGATCVCQACRGERMQGGADTDDQSTRKTCQAIHAPDRSSSVCP